MAPFLCVNNRHNDIVFQPRKDEYMCLAFRCDDALTKDDVLVEIGEYGVPAIILVRHEAGYWQINVKVPPGISPGNHDVRVGTKTGGFSDPVRIKMLPAGAERRYGETPFIAQSEEFPVPQFVQMATMDRSLTFRGYRSIASLSVLTGRGRAGFIKVQLTVDGNPWPLLSVG